MLNEIKKDSEDRMIKSVEALRNELAKMRTGRAHPSLIEHIKVDYYGNETSLNQMANITAADARTLLVTPWEKTMVPNVEKAIVNANLGLNPVAAGQAIRVPLPPLTEERRKDLSRVVRSEAEEARIAIRNIRRDANSQLKDLLKNKDITEDDERRIQNDIQKLTDNYIKIVDEVLQKKEADLMVV